MCAYPAMTSHPLLRLRSCTLSRAFVSPRRSWTTPTIKYGAATAPSTILLYSFSAPTNSASNTLVNTFIAPAGGNGRNYAFQVRTSTGDASEVSIASGAASPALAVTAGATSTILVSSMLDGSYAFKISRASLSAIRVVVTSSAPATSSDLSSSVTPLGYLPTVSAYALSVPYLYVTATLTLTFVTAGSITIGGAVCVSGSPCAPTTLAVGANAITVTSSWEGTVTYTVTRAPPSGTLFLVACYNGDQSLWVHQTLSPLWTYGALNYTLSVPFVYSQCAIALNYLASDAVLFSSPGYTPVPVASGSASTAYAMPAGGGAIVMYAVSALDGQYSAVATRAAPVLGSIALAAGPSQPALPAYAPAYSSNAWAPYGVALLLPYGTSSVSVLAAASAGALYYALNGPPLTRGAGPVTSTGYPTSGFGPQSTLDSTNTLCVINLAAPLPAGFLVAYDYYASASNGIVAATYRQEANGAFFIVGASPYITATAASATLVNVQLTAAQQWSVQAGDYFGLW
jgi:hypothetical protein